MTEWRSLLRSQDYQWWRDALAGKKPPIHEIEPQAGWYKMRRVRNGPELPVVLWWAGEVDPENPIDENGDPALIGDAKIFARIGTESASAHEIWTWVCAYPVTLEDFNRLSGSAPLPVTHKGAIDLKSAPTPF